MSVLCIVFSVLCVSLLRFVFGQDPPCACIEIGNNCNFQNRYTPEDGSRNKENVALGKSPQLSSTWETLRPEYGKFLNQQGCLANNGNRNTTYMAYFINNATANCISTYENDLSPSWTLDLLYQYTISNIVIYSSKGHEQRMINTSIFVDGQLCYKFTKLMPTMTSLKCGTTLTGRFINVSKSSPISLKSYDHNLNICEVEVWVCIPGFYGNDCEKSCENCTNGCHVLNGTCLDAACPEGYYGDACSVLCGACTGNQCYMNGTCINGCENGWEGDKCNEGNKLAAATDDEGHIIGSRVGISLTVSAILLGLMSALLFVLTGGGRSKKDEPKGVQAMPLTPRQELPHVEIVMNEAQSVEEPKPSPVEQTPVDQIAMEQTPAVEDERKEEEGWDEVEEESEYSDPGEIVIADTEPVEKLTLSSLPEIIVEETSVEHSQVKQTPVAGDEMKLDDWYEGEEADGSFYTDIEGDNESDGQEKHEGPP